MVFLLIFTGIPEVKSETYMKKISLITDIGLGNLISIYGAYSISKNQNIGLGCGYLYYSDYDTDVSINIIEPSVMWMISVADMFLIRARAGIDFIGRKNEKLKTTAYVIAPDFLIKAIRFKKSSIYAGVSLPFVIGKEGVDIDTVIGAGYMIDFNIGVKKERKKSITKLINKLPGNEKEEIKRLYFFGLDSYYKEDVKGAIKYWKKIETTDKEFKERIEEQIEKARDELNK